MRNNNTARYLSLEEGFGRKLAVLAIGGIALLGLSRTSDPTGPSHEKLTTVEGLRQAGACETELRPEVELAEFMVSYQGHGPRREQENMQTLRDYRVALDLARQYEVPCSPASGSVIDNLTPHFDTLTLIEDGRCAEELRADANERPWLHNDKLIQRNAEANLELELRAQLAESLGMPCE